MKNSNGTIGSATTGLQCSKGQRVSETRPFVRYSVVGESTVVVEHGEMLQSVLVHNSDTLKDIYCDICGIY